MMILNAKQNNACDQVIQCVKTMKTLIRFVKKIKCYQLRRETSILYCTYGHSENNFKNNETWNSFLANKKMFGLRMKFWKRYLAVYLLFFIILSFPPFVESNYSWLCLPFFITLPHFEHPFLFELFRSSLFFFCVCCFLCNPLLEVSLAQFFPINN